MRLIDEVRLFREQGGKPRGARTVIQDDVLVAEFDARLHDDGDDAGQRSVESVAAENLAVDLQSVARLFEARGLDLRNGVVRTSRRGNLGADHINRHGASERGGRAFGPGSQSCRALRNRRVAQRLRFTPAAHRRVEMELPKAGPRVGIHHVFCLAHRRLGRLVAPWVWAEMVAAEDEATGGQVFPARNVHRPAHEIGWLHARVAAELVDLVAGRLNQQRRPGVCGLARGGLDHQRMGGADRRHPLRRPLPPRGGERRESVDHERTLGVVAMNASSSARVPAPSIGPCRVTLRAPAAFA